MAKIKKVRAPKYTYTSTTLKKVAGVKNATTIEKLKELRAAQSQQAVANKAESLKYESSHMGEGNRTVYASHVRVCRNKAASNIAAQKSIRRKIDRLKVTDKPKGIIPEKNERNCDHDGPVLKNIYEVAELAKDKLTEFMVARNPIEADEALVKMAEMVKGKLEAEGLRINDDHPDYLTVDGFPCPPKPMWATRGTQPAVPKKKAVAKQPKKAVDGDNEGDALKLFTAQVKANAKANKSIKATAKRVKKSRSSGAIWVGAGVAKPKEKPDYWNYESIDEEMQNYEE